jgi:hypothetical protein
MGTFAEKGPLSYDPVQVWTTLLWAFHYNQNGLILLDQ